LRQQAYVVRLYRALVQLGFQEFELSAAKLWSWVTTFQIPSIVPGDRATSLFVNFFEDMSAAGNRNSWSVLELVRLLVDERDSVDADWKQHADALLGLRTP
jgi:hypothetical protein